MVQNRRRFSREFKLRVIRELEAQKSVAEVSRSYQVHPATIGRWRRQYRQHPDTAFQGNGHLYRQQAQIAQLERLLGQLTAENAFLKKALEHLEKTVQSI